MQSLKNTVARLVSLPPKELSKYAIQLGVMFALDYLSLHGLMFAGNYLWRDFTSSIALAFEGSDVEHKMAEIAKIGKFAAEEESGASRTALGPLKSVAEKNQLEFSWLQTFITVIIWEKSGNVITIYPKGYL